MTLLSLELPKGRLSFSTQLPMLQLAWDSTSVGAFKECPRKYYYNIVCGFVPREESVHLTFGLHYHAALEAYDHARAQGGSHVTSQRHAVRKALELTWNSTFKRPWASDHRYKNRLTLIRSIVWYLEQFSDDPLQTIILANGKPAVELSWRLDLERTTRTTGETFHLCGHLDRLANFNDAVWIVDRKTTTHTVDSEFFTRYNPDNQFSTYIYAGQVVYKERVQGIIADVAQVLVDFTRLQRGFVFRTNSQLEEWRTDLDYWISMAEACAEASYWPQNDKSCGLYGGCPYRAICGRAPEVRPNWLKAQFTSRVWDPLKVRGDI